MTRRATVTGCLARIDAGVPARHVPFHVLGSCGAGGLYHYRSGALMCCTGYGTYRPRMLVYHVVRFTCLRHSSACRRITQRELHGFLWQGLGALRQEAFPLADLMPPSVPWPPLLLCSRVKSWHNVANVMYVDQPLGTGLSYTRESNYAEDDQQVGINSTHAWGLQN